MSAKPVRRPSAAPLAARKRAPARRARSNGADAAAAVPPIAIRHVRRADLDPIVALDARVTGVQKRDYWRNVYRRYGEGSSERQFLVAESAGEVVGFVIGEVRDWEFGSPRCGWVFAIDVSPEARQNGTGAQLLEAVCAGFRRAGVRKVRTMLNRDNTLVLSFFRSQGMMAGPFIPLEMDLE
jgi:ribosomal protein S18 acetylase RimI-like enzyme